MNADKFVPRNLDSAVATIKDYAAKHNIEPQIVLDIFNVGIFAFTVAGALDKDADAPVIHQVK